MKALKKQQRESNIELIRIFAIGGVVLLHYNYGRALTYVVPYSINSFLLIALESFFICAVDLFMMIPGYFCWHKDEWNILRAFTLLLDVISIKVMYCVATSLYHMNVPSIKQLISCFIPANYFVILYISVMLVSPFVNRLVNIIDYKGFKRLLVVLFLLFSIAPMVIDSFYIVFNKKPLYDNLSTISIAGSAYGYSFVNFLFMYIIGAFIGRFDYKIERKKALIGIAILWTLLCMLGYFTFLNSYEIHLAYSYCSPIVICLAAFYLLLFKSYNINFSKVVNTLASASFYVYLTHAYVLDLMNQVIAGAVSSNVVILFVNILVCIVASFVLGIIIKVTLRPLEKFLENMIDSKLLLVSAKSE